MEIDNKNNKKGFSQIRKKLSFKRVTILVLVFFGIIIFGITNIAYGAYLNKTGQTPLIKMFFLRAKELDFTFIPKYGKSKLIDRNMISIDVNFKNWQKIKYYREKGLNQESLNNLPPEEVNAKIRFKNKTYKAKISITGQTTQHIQHPYKWSLLIKLKNGETINGVNKFALLYPRARGYLTDWIALKLLKSQGLIELKTDFIDVEINGKNHGLYYFEERFAKNLLVNNNRINGIIFKHDGHLKVYELNKEILKSKELTSQLIYLEKLIHSFYTNKVSIEKVFDIKKFATLFVVSDLMNQKHALFRGNSRLYFNPVTNLIEPIGREWGYLRKETFTSLSLSIENPNPNVNYHEELHKDSLLTKFIHSNQFIKEYNKQAVILSNKSYLDSILRTNEQEFNSLLSKIYTQNPFYNFPIDLLYKNQEIIRNKIYPNTPSLNIYFSQIKNDSIILNFENRTDLPLEVQNIKYNDSILYQKNKIFIKPKYMSKKTDQNFTCYLNKNIARATFSSDSLEVNYNILGIQKNYKTIVFPKIMTKNNYEQLTPTKLPENISDFSFLNLDKKNITFSDENCEISKDLIIPEGYTLKINPGCKIDLTNSSRIISYSPIIFKGNNENPITIMSSDSTGQGIVVFNAGRISEISNVNFNLLSNINENKWNLKSCITFYESPVNINNCSFNNNISGDHVLNLIRTDFNIFNSKFKNNYSNALGITFCQGNIENVKFQFIEKNAINSLGSKIFMKDIEIENCNNYGIRGEKDSQLICNNIKVKDSDIAFIILDNSTMKIDEAYINSCNIALCAFQENPSYGPGNIELKNSLIKNVQNEFLIEVGSSVTYNGKNINHKIKKVAKHLK